MEDLLPKVQKAFEYAFGIDPQTVTIDCTPNDIAAWDSMGHVQLASSLERAFGLSFDVEDLMEMEDVRKIVKVVQFKLGKVHRVEIREVELCGPASPAVARELTSD
jgi:acyl carrier protein